MKKIRYFERIFCFMPLNYEQKSPSEYAFQHFRQKPKADLRSSAPSCAVPIRRRARFTASAATAAVNWFSSVLNDFFGHPHAHSFYMSSFFTAPFLIQISSPTQDIRSERKSETRLKHAKRELWEGIPYILNPGAYFICLYRFVNFWFSFDYC